MFSFFKNGISDTYPKKELSLSSLADTIRTNPNSGVIKGVRQLRKHGYETYKAVKGTLSNITPCCKLKRRKLVGSPENLLSISGYVYVDIDLVDTDVEEYKNSFIKKYQGCVSLVAKSASLGGISTLFKVSGGINSKEEYELAWDYIVQNILALEPVDPNSRPFTQAMFVSFDPEVYINEDALVTVRFNKKKSQSSPKVNSVSNISTETYIPEFSHYSTTETTFNHFTIETGAKKLKLKTVVSIDKPIVDVIPIHDYVDIKFSTNIPDTKKHKVYNSIIHRLIYLNPDASYSSIHGFISFINEKYIEPSMDVERLQFVTSYIYKLIKENPNYTFKGGKLKMVHFADNSGISGEEKKSIASKINGMLRVNKTIQKILDAKEALRRAGKEITQKALIKMGISQSSVKRHWRKEQLNDISEYLDHVNQLFKEDNKTSLK